MHIDKAAPPLRQTTYAQSTGTAKSRSTASISSLSGDLLGSDGGAATGGAGLAANGGVVDRWAIWGEASALNKCETWRLYTEGENATVPPREAATVSN